jgi:parallel beta-helix repeat protein
MVSGRCQENLLIPEEVQRITLDGQGKATISGTDKAKDTILVYGRRITIKGFTITGGRDGIQILMGGTALVDGNTIEKAERFGVYVSQHSSARIVNNTIQNNGEFGITVSGGSFAYIGFLGYLDLMDKTTSPNVIQGNGRAGIHVHRTSYARIAGNTVSNNKLNGIEVEGVSHAQIGGNTINGNGIDGLHVSENSSVNLGSGKGTRILDIPNGTTKANKGFGISCSEGGSTNGSLGSLNGAKGAKDFDNSCADRLRP